MGGGGGAHGVDPRRVDPALSNQLRITAKPALKVGRLGDQTLPGREATCPRWPRNRGLAGSRSRQCA